MTRIIFTPIGLLSYPEEEKNVALSDDGKSMTAHGVFEEISLLLYASKR